VRAAVGQQGPRYQADQTSDAVHNDIPEGLSLDDAHALIHGETLVAA